MAVRTEYNKAYRQMLLSEHPERLVEYRRRHKRPTMEQRREWQRRYYIRHHDRILEREKAKRAANPERYAELVRNSTAKKAAEYRERHLLYHKLNAARYVEHANARRARIKKLTIGDRKALREFYTWARNTRSIPCWWCGAITECDRKRHIDHAEPVSRGGIHAVSNLYVVCSDCNHRKHGRPLIVWLRMIRDQVRAVAVPAGKDNDDPRSA